jgi:bifunctional non-homologous end joining protein LigD
MGWAGTHASRVKARGLPRMPLTFAALPFMLPVLVDEVPEGPDWVFEPKLDGVRVLALRVRGRAQLCSRNGLDVTGQYPEVAAAIDRLPGEDLALDGEIVALDEQGRPRFQLLQRRMHTTRHAAEVPIIAYLYDCLALWGRDLRRLGLRDRKALLRELVPASDPLRYTDHFEGDGARVFRAACEAGLEGVIAKRADGPYRGGRRPEWRKIKCQRRQEFVIGGYTDPKGTRTHFGAVHLGVYEDDALVYVGRAGSGLDGAGLRDLHRRLHARAVAACPFTRGEPPRGREHHWVRPELVCEVRFSEWTTDGHLRHPVFLGLREDKRPEEVRRERAATPRS